MLLSTYSTLPVDYLFYFFHPIMHKVKSLVATYFFKAGLERSMKNTMIYNNLPALGKLFNYTVPDLCNLIFF